MALYYGLWCHRHVNLMAAQMYEIGSRRYTETQQGTPNLSLKSTAYAIGDVAPTMIGTS